jgi:uncharacterized lipoprotein YmbA
VNQSRRGLNARRAVRVATGTLAIALGASLCGCSLLSRTVPVTHRYQVVGTPVAADLPPDAKIELRTVGGAEPYQDTGIAYQTSLYRLDSYHFHRWVEPPTDILREHLRQILYRPSNLGSQEPNAKPLLLDARIQAFQEVDEGAKHSGLVTVQFCLYPGDPFARALWCTTVSKQTPADGKGPENAAAAINLSFDAVMAQFARDLTREARQIAAQRSARPAPAVVQ